MWILILTGGFGAIMGFYYLTTNRSVLWKQQERRFRAQGIINRQRTPEWERSQTLHGYFLLALGIVTVIAGMMLGAATTRQNNRSSLGEQFFIDGREISREEAARMGFPNTSK